MRAHRLILALAFCAAGAASARAPSPTALPPLTVQDLVRLARVSEPAVSPDGKRVAYALRTTDMDANKGRTDIWLLDLAQKDPQPRRLTSDPANDMSPRWAPDSHGLYFLSTRGGSSQVWSIRIDGGEATRVTNYPLDVGALKVAPRGDVLAISMDVLPECNDLRCTKDKLDARAKDKSTGRIYDKIFIRHWDTWSDGTRSHLFAARIGADGTAGMPVE